jgi:peroxiredoxin
MLLETPLCDFGWKAPAFQLPDLDGRSIGLEDVRGPKGMLVAFICNHCPYVKAIIAGFVQDAIKLQDLGIGVAAIMSNDYRAYPADAPDRMKAFAAEHSFTFPYLLDESQEVARAYSAVCTPDFFGFDAGLGLQYRGRILGNPMKPASGAKRELLEAMSAVANGKPGPQDQKASMGCSLKWKA